jgi:2-dehydro-3-deoxygalactonokinase
MKTSTDRPSSPPQAARDYPACAVGIDWGTTNRRGYLLDTAGRSLAVHTDDDGMLAARGRFAESLHAMLEALGAHDAPLPVLMAGMVGSASGWVEVPYARIGAPLSTLAGQLHRFDHHGRSLAIVPGCMLDREGRVDVMRGEETQLLGAQALGHGDGWYVLPGTHSKWVRMEAGAIADFATFMTGELFALLNQHGTLAAALAGPTPPGLPPDGQAFELALRAAAGGALSNSLFGCRARVVTGRLRPEAARDHLSGLLIGAEWQDIAQRQGGKLPTHVRAIGAPDLVHRHAQAAAAFGVTLERIDAAQATIAGLAALLGYGRQSAQATPPSP